MTARLQQPDAEQPRPYIVSMHDDGDHSFTKRIGAAYGVNDAKRQAELDHPEYHAVRAWPEEQVPA